MPPSANGTHFPLDGLEQVCGYGQGPVGVRVLRRSYSVRRTQNRVAATDGEACAILGPRRKFPPQDLSSPEGEGRVAFRPLPHCPAEPAFWTKGQNNKFFSHHEAASSSKVGTGFFSWPLFRPFRKGFHSAGSLPLGSAETPLWRQVPVCSSVWVMLKQKSVWECPGAGGGSSPTHLWSCCRGSSILQFILSEWRLYRKLVWWLTTHMRHS